MRDTVEPLTCQICDKALTGGTDTFGTYPTNLCHSCYLGVQRDNDRPGDLSVRGKISLCVMRRRAARKPVFDEPNLPHDWKTEAPDGLFSPPQGEWRQSDVSQSICPACFGKVVYEVNEWEWHTGLPTEGGITAWCEAEYQNHVKGAGDTKHGNVTGEDSMLAVSRFYSLCLNAVAKRLMKEEGLS